MSAINIDDFFYKGISSDDEQAYIAGFMNSLDGLAENAKQFLRKNNVEISSAKFRELEAIADENFIDSFNCRMRQPTKYLDPALSTKEANLISHDDFYLVAAVKVIIWTREAQLIFKDIEGMGMDTVGTKSAIIGLAHHVGLIDRATNALDFSDVLASAKASKSARHDRTHALKPLVEDVFDRLVEERVEGAKLPQYMDVIRVVKKVPRVEEGVNDKGNKVLKFGDSSPISFETIKDWLIDKRKSEK